VAFLGIVGVDAHAGRSWFEEARGMAWWGNIAAAVANAICDR
jgi:hypothetical protein